jgi:hypothetical protein
MDILNFIYWIKGKRFFKTVDPATTLLPVALKDNRRDDDYLTGAITVQDFIDQVGAGTPGPQGPVGPQGVQGIQGIQGIPGPIGTTGLFAQTALSTPITNTTVETSIVGTGVGTLSVPANGFQVGDSFALKMCGKLSCANNETIHIRIKSNGVVIGDLGVFQMKISTNKYFELVTDFTITKIGAAGVAELFVNGQYSYNQNANTQLDGSNFALVSNTVFDTTIINSLTITAQWGLANASNSIQSQNFVLTKVY